MKLLWVAVRAGLPEEVEFEWGEGGCVDSWGREVQAEGTASAKAPRQEESRQAGVAGGEVRQRRGLARVL